MSYSAPHSCGMGKSIIQRALDALMASGAAGWMALVAIAAILLAAFAIYAMLLVMFRS